MVGKLNGQQAKLVKQNGEFIWHKHENDDKLFYEGSLKMEFRDKTVVVNEIEFLVVPHGVEHNQLQTKMYPLCFLNLPLR